MKKKKMRKRLEALERELDAVGAREKGWRVGRSLGRTLYRDGVFVGTVDTPALAADIVAAMNGPRSGR